MDSSRRLRNALQCYFDALVKEPPPERWADLIERLNNDGASGREPKRHRGKNLKLGRARWSAEHKRSSSKRMDQ
jgi:hypothetical protein